jgi:pyruvate/2-oxoglutarate dehydrogenase complex dihydrolipoamide acyltransferase (E2) component
MIKALIVAATLLALPASAHAYVYWTNATAGNGVAAPGIGRALSDGGGALQTFVAAPPNPCGVAVDATHLYWANAAGPAGSGTTIGRARLDGSEPDPAFITQANGPCGVAVDGTHISWANYAADTISRARLDGSHVEPDFITGANGPCGVAVDAGHVYWANLGSGLNLSSLGRARLDGSQKEPEWVTAIAPCGVAVNATHVYWANYLVGYGSSIGRARIDGSDPVLEFIRAEGDYCPAPCQTAPVGVALDDRHVYWANRSRDSIGRARLDGGGIERDFITGARNPVGVAVDALPAADPPPPATPAATPAPTATPGAPKAPERRPAASARIASLRRDATHGTARLRVAVSAPGTLRLRGDRVRTATRRATRAATYTLALRPTARTARVLERRRRTRVRVRLTFAPATGPATTYHRTVELIRTTRRGRG